jgi:hypothetical protein
MIFVDASPMPVDVLMTVMGPNGVTGFGDGDGMMRSW